METILTEELIELAEKRSAHFPVEGFLWGIGPIHPRFMLVGEAPGEVESLNGIPFTGRAGIELMKFFDFLEVTREEVFITSTFRSRPYQEKEKIDRKTGERFMRKYNRTPTKKEIIAHAPLLDYEIKTIDPPIILTMGNVGLQRLIGNQAKIMQLHGQLYEGPIQKLATPEATTYTWTTEQYRIFPTFHPASIFYNRQLLEMIYEDLALFKTYLS
ncbi:uracil-DNA glycosylase [Carnobacterium antarcticum]|uniref:Uracil-DNA glycosylase n=1 Tax=Carnobacterium antarcticum TaxID=2126436 RepID=A0ABW4NQT8_9LACT|nr:uracil-DNA glycosylase [Carnobacterium sp. CP1]ALV21281.1 Uracil-DNA glycosylase [Carnobacterium sp. CP1]